MKDLIAHVAAYENWTAAQIRAANEGRAPTDMELYGVEELPPDAEGWDLDRQNAAIYARYKDMPLAEVKIFAKRAFADLIAAVEGVGEEDLARPECAILDQWHAAARDRSRPVLRALRATHRGCAHPCRPRHRVNRLSPIPHRQPADHHAACGISRSNMARTVASRSYGTRRKSTLTAPSSRNERMASSAHGGMRASPSGRN